MKSLKGHMIISGEDEQNSYSALQRLRTLLVEPEMLAVSELQEVLQQLRDQVRDPEQRIQLIVPVLTEIIRRAILESREAVAKAIAPVIDRAIHEQARVDKESLAAALAPILTEVFRQQIAISPEKIASTLAPVSTRAIAHQHAHAPHQVAGDLAPIIGSAIKEQVRSERDTMVDALYPIIGTTIAKYVSETLNNLIQSINEKIERNVSVHGIIQRVRGKLMGVSDAELMLRKSVPCIVEAAFLIHKSSGLVIAQAQRSAAVVLDPDLLSGMLTAFRSFFNETMMRAGPVSELDQIEYGQSKIILEVAGSCYLAAVVLGEPTEILRTALRDTLVRLVQTYGEKLTQFSGSTQTVPGDVTDAIARLVSPGREPFKRRGTSRRYSLIFTLAILVFLVLMPVQVMWYRNRVDSAAGAQAGLALTSAPLTRSDRLHVNVDGDSVRISGVVPNAYVRDVVEEIVRRNADGRTITNSVLTAEAPSFPLLTSTKVKEVSSVLNRIEGVFVAPRCSEGALVIEGTTRDSSLKAKVAQAFARLPGIVSFKNNIEVRNPDIDTRIYFDVGSTSPKQGENRKLTSFMDYVRRDQEGHFLIIGHADKQGTTIANRRIAVGRAITIREFLIRGGINAGLIRAEGDLRPAPGTSGFQYDSLSRCVRFERVATSPHGGF